MSTSAAGVLLVTPFPDEQDMYAELLRYVGFDVSVCAGPDEALAIAAAPRFDVAVVRLPERRPADAVTVLRQLRADARTNRLGLVLITTHVRLEYRRAADAAGCDAFIILPSPPEELLSIIRRLVRERRLPTGRGDV